MPLWRRAQLKAQGQLYFTKRFNKWSEMNYFLMNSVYTSPYFEYAMQLVSHVLQPTRWQ